MNRNTIIDICRGILIIFVVIGHSSINQHIINIIFWFHMPLFFITSGYLLRLPEYEVLPWIKKKAIRILLPGVTYWFLCSLITENISVKALLYFLYGGRMISGVYWYATVLFLSEILWVFLLKYTGTKARVTVIIVCYWLSIIESNYLIPKIHSDIPWWLCFPWNVDVVLLAVVFIAIGYIIQQEPYRQKNQSAFLPAWGVLVSIMVSVAAVGAECHYSDFYRLDMKYSCYRNPLLLLVLVASFGLIILYMARLLNRITYLNQVVAYIGRCSAVIMYTHLLVKSIVECNPVQYVFLSIAIGCGINLTLSKLKVLKLLLALS